MRNAKGTETENKNAGPKAGVQSCACARLAALGGIAVFFATLVLAVVAAIVDAGVKVMAALAADVMAVGPDAMVSVARDPDHLVVASPVARAMTIVRAVAEFD